ncbi:hypothetical protein FRACYDRAFT_275258 [Fragilariopsis cylindrus CCMP1102]|uniref:Uncharacterized protein n=1 Tax=Fragilariopsis cylindrus CCMP1102 TaxID=635003 RepID=A0A1E7FDC7_9STRA|nr:hypothetical protein FRACYDRAFT_275258 [Fragilariopsis cylindrus CCMP1102]|eukprot:OEU16126.1 hypothetical protein FRACYDRAFT_275258 [Fragilariopsis cylindrus CCMP1102]
MCESHRSESSRQSSLYYKIALFRWVTSAVVIFIITPFTATLGTGDIQAALIPQVTTLFFSDMILTNILALADPAGHLMRHFLAPRAKTQDAMNILFQGSQYELAERYTDMTKILFLNLFYCSIFPSSFFLCAISLCLKYLVDRFNLMRTWKKAPHTGNHLLPSWPSFLATTGAASHLIAYARMILLIRHMWALLHYLRTWEIKIILQM